MVNLNYCPQCGTAKLGRFCAGCGFNLQDVEAVLAGIGVATTSEVSVAQQEPPAPANAGVPGLIYGDTYDAGRDCSNCGSEMQDDVCGLCAN